MKRVKTLAFVICCLAAAAVVGCVSHPSMYCGSGYGSGFGSGMGYKSMGLGFGLDYVPGYSACEGVCGSGCSSGCSPYVPDVACGPSFTAGCAPEIDCEVIEFGSNPCGGTTAYVVKDSGMPYFPQRGGIVDCRTSISNMTHGGLLFGRGVLDIAAAPFVLIGNALSNGCRFKVVTFMPDTRFGLYHQTVSGPCCPAGNTGCDSCGDEMNGLEVESSTLFDTQSQHRPMLQQPPLRRSNSVVQANYMEQTAPTVKFVQPQRRAVK